MKQLKLHFGLFFRKLTLQIVFVIIAILSVIFVFLYYYLVYSNDELIKYFPNNTSAYISFKIDEKNVESKFFDKIFLPLDMKIKIAQLISNNLNQSASRNIAIGLIKEKDDYVPLVILYLNKQIKNDEEIFEILKNNGYYSFKIDNPVFKKNYLVITKSQDFSEKIKDVVEHSEKSLNKNLLLIFGRQTISNENGIFYADVKVINHYLSNIKSLIGIEIDITRPILTSFSINNERILAITQKYKQNSKLLVPNNKKVDYLVLSSNPIQLFNNFIRNNSLSTNLIEYEQMINGNFDKILNQNNIISLNLAHFIDNNYKLSINSTNSTEINSVIKEGFRKILAFNEQKDKNILLPDQTLISVKVKNYDDIYFNKNNDLINDVKNDSYHFIENNTKMDIYKNIKPTELEYSELVGCDYDENAETLILSDKYLSTIPLFGKIANFGVFSTYTQTYPQFLLCLN